MRFLRRILFSTGPRLGLTVGMLGVLLVGFVAIAPYRQAEDSAVGYLIAFVGFSWAAITGYLGRDYSLKLEMGSFFGCGFLLACVASFISVDAINRSGLRARQGDVEVIKVLSLELLEIAVEIARRSHITGGGRGHSWRSDPGLSAFVDELLAGEIKVYEHKRNVA